MKHSKVLLPLKMLFLFWLIFFASCNDSKEIPPFPTSENEYEQPGIKSFEFSEMDTLEEISMKPFKLNALPRVKFDWDKIPSKPFDIGVPYTLSEPLPTQPFEWDSLPSAYFNLDSLPQEKLKIKVKVLGAPKRVKAGYPVTMDGASRGIMTLDGNFGFSGQALSHIIDKGGLLWFGTSAGLVKYDSENLEIYDEEQGLISRNIMVVFEDSKDRIWVGDDQGSISVIDFKANLIYELSSAFETALILGIMEANDGNFWVSNGNLGYKIIDLKEKIIRQLNAENGLLHTFGVAPFQDKEGLIWLTTGAGVNIIDLKDFKNISLTSENGLFDGFVTSILQDSSGKFWIGGDEGIAILNSTKDTASYLYDALKLPKEVGIFKLYQDKNEKIWIGADTGLLFSYAESTETIEKFVIKKDENEFIFGITEDNQGQIWASSFQGGIYLLNPNGGRPGNFTTDDGLASNNNWSTLEAKDGSIWIGSSTDGIDIYNPITKRVKHLSKGDGLISEQNDRLIEDSKGRIWAYSNQEGISLIDPERETIQRISGTDQLDGARLSSILEDKRGNFWMGNITGQLFFLDIKNEVFNKYIIDSSDVDPWIDNIIQDNQNQIWVSGRELGVHKIDPINNTRVKLLSSNGLADDQVYSMMKDDQGKLWVATQRGVQVIDIRNKELTTFTTSEGIGANDVYALIEQGDKILLGTSKGLTIIKEKDIKGREKSFWEVKTLANKQGLDHIDFNMNSFSIDKKGRLWAGVDDEILTIIDVLNLDTTAFKPSISGINIFDKRNSFKNVEFIKESYAKEDTIWVGDKNKFYVQSKVAVDSTIIIRDNILWESVEGPYNLPVGLTLPHNQNYLSFNFNGAQFSNPDKMVFRYALEGIDKNWSPISDKTTSENYRDLPPGAYTFKVASKGFNGVWSEPTEFKFVIIPPWWQTWWAYTIFVALFLGLGLVILHYRSQWLKKENRILEERVNHRTAQLKKTIEELENTQSQLIHSEKMASLGELTAGIAHEIQNPMNFINNFSEVSIELIDEMREEMDKGELEEAKTISKDIAQNLDKITHHGKRASSIVKGMLEHSRNTSGQKELTDINVLADEYLRLAYHGLRAKNKSFNADFKTDLDASLAKIEVVPQDLGRVLLNLINNAFYAVAARADEEKDAKYKPLVNISTKKLKDQVVITVKDNGQGIPKDIKDKIFQPFFTTKPTGKGTGLGLSLAYDIVTQGHGGALELKTTQGEGTEFLIYIPISKS